MALQKQANRNLTRFNIIFGFLFLLGITLPPKIQAHPRIQGQNENHPLASNQMVQALAKRNLHFAFKMYKQMFNREDSMFSPLSLSIALALKELFNALDLNGFYSPVDIIKGYNDILQSLNSFKGTDLAITITNKFAIDKNFHIKKPIKDILVDEFQTQSKSLNFGDNDQGLFNEINECVKQTTRNKIENMASLGNGEKIMGPVLMSAIYFKGKWAQQFRKENTKTETFHVKNNKDLLEATLHTRGDFYYVEDETLDSKVLRVDYTGFRFAMYVFLPNKLNGFQSLKNNLNAERFENIIKNMRLKEVAVTLPRFNSKCIKDISPDLKNLEIKDLEVEANKEQNKASTSTSFVKKIFYAAYVEMSEEEAQAIAQPNAPASGDSASGIGTSAAAMGTANAATPQNETSKEFYANHAFVFIIYDTLTNFILFIGNVNHPVQ